jgi:ATP-binding cassette, subfamily B (MDR/TAP), member 1
MLKMPIAWFDKPKNSSGALSARLASDCKSINGLITTFLAISIQSATTLIAGVIIALIYEWRTALVALALLPIMVIAGIVQMSFTEGFSDKTDKVYKESSSLITESMNHIRTVLSFGSEDIVQRKYDAGLVEPLAMGVKKGMVSGALYGVSQFILFLVFGLIFYFGVIFMVDNNLEMANVFTAIYAITFSGMTAGNNAHFMPDMAAGKKAAASIFDILDSSDEDQIQIDNKSKMLKTNIKGEVSFRNVSFKYESRDHMVFEDLSFDIASGQKIGFVGPSGCGKSTVLQLLQRFYDADKG